MAAGQLAAGRVTVSTVPSLPAASTLLLPKNLPASLLACHRKTRRQHDMIGMQIRSGRQKLCIDTLAASLQQAIHRGLLSADPYPVAPRIAAESQHHAKFNLTSHRSNAGQ